MRSYKGTILHHDPFPNSSNSWLAALSALPVVKQCHGFRDPFFGSGHLDRICRITSMCVAARVKLSSLALNHKYHTLGKWDFSANFQALGEFTPNGEVSTFCRSLQVEVYHLSNLRKTIIQNEEVSYVSVQELV